VLVQCLLCEFKSSSPAMMRRHCGPSSKTHAKSALTGADFFSLMETGAWTLEDLDKHAPPPPAEASAPKRAPSIATAYWLGLVNTIADAADVQRQYKVAAASRAGVKPFLSALQTQGAALLEGPEGAVRQKFKLAIAKHLIQKKDEGGGAFCAHAIVGAWPLSGAFAAYQEGKRRYLEDWCTCPAGAECVCEPPAAGFSVPGFPALPTMDDGGTVFNLKDGVLKFQQQLGNLRGRYRVRLSPAPPRATAPCHC